MSKLLLEGSVDDRDLIISGLREQLRQSNDALASERSKNGTTDRGLTELRSTLSPLYNALKHVFGEMDAMGIDHSDSAAPHGQVDARKAAIWNDWKAKFPGHPSKAIDALLLHGSMTQGQLRIHVGCATGTISNVVSALNKAGLINKNGGRITLKEL